MSRWRVIWNKKWKPEQAETLTELLVSVLVIALGLMMFASVLLTARGMIGRRETQFLTYYQERNALEKGMYETDTELILEQNGEKTSLGYIAVQTAAGNYKVQLFSDAAENPKRYRYRRQEE